MRTITSCSAFLLETRYPEAVTAVRHVLTGAGIPYDTGAQPDQTAQVAFFVPPERLEQAKALVEPMLSHGEPDFDGFDAAAAAEGHPPAGLPWGAVQLVLGLVLGHLMLVFATTGARPLRPEWLTQGALLAGGTLDQPWRLLTSLALHGGVRHVLWNGLAMLVFAVPLLERLGRARTATVYLVAGIGGSLAALALAPAGTRIVGSSGAVAGLFGAWLVLALRDPTRQDWRSRVRVSGIGLLVLPSLLAPLDADGQSISVASHMGGMFGGMLLGALLSLGLGRRPVDEKEEDPGRSSVS